jgi:hypothetical protein
MKDNDILLSPKNIYHEYILLWRRGMDFSGMTPASIGMLKKIPPKAIASGGSTCLWHAVDPAIPCWVASPQSPTPLHRIFRVYENMGGYQIQNWLRKITKKVSNGNQDVTLSAAELLRPSTAR